MFQHGATLFRLSMTSMTSEEETQHVERLKLTQREEKRQGVQRKSTTSSMVSKETLLGLIRKVVASWAFEAFYAFATERFKQSWQLMCKLMCFKGVDFTCFFFGNY